MLVTAQCSFDVRKCAWMGLVGEWRRHGLGELEISEIKVAKPWCLWLCFAIILKVCATKASGFIEFKQVMQALKN